MHIVIKNIIFIIMFVAFAVVAAAENSFIMGSQENY